MRRIGVLLAAFFAVALVITAPVSARTADKGSVGIEVPSFDVRLSMGFNYDLLRSLTDVSFIYPRGYLGLNLPIPSGNVLNKEMMDDLFSDTGLFRKSDAFKPTAGATQNANTTVRVDVPMLGGVGSFAYTQNFFFNLSTAMGGSSVISAHRSFGNLNSGDEDEYSGFLALRGAMRMPLSLSLGWETMTFGYAYRVNDDLAFALNLHRHLFSMDLRVRADIDLLGHIQMDGKVKLDDDQNAISMRIDEELINFDSEKCNGTALGRYRAEAWTPSIGVKWWRFRVDSRFGLDVKAKGSAKGGFMVPRVVDLEQGAVELLENMDVYEDSINARMTYVFDMLDSESGIISREVDTVTYEIGNTLRWKMPQGHTLAFDIVPERFSVSYTKLFGEVNLRIDDIVRTKKPEGRGDWLADSEDTLKVDLGLKVDHVIMLEYRSHSFFMNAGVFGVRARSEDSYAFESIDAWPRMGDFLIVPVLSGGLNLGTRLQLHIGANILPLPAVKTGVNYYF